MRGRESPGLWMPRLPTHTWLTLYQIARARGWPRRAEAEGEIAASLHYRIT